MIGKLFLILIAIVVFIGIGFFIILGFLRRFLVSFFSRKSHSTADNRILYNDGKVVVHNKQNNDR